MSRNVSDETARVVDHVDDAGLSRLPDEVLLALADIGEVAREGLLALSVTAGLAVLGEMMEAERTGLCGATIPRRLGIYDGSPSTPPSRASSTCRVVPTDPLKSRST